MNHRKDHRSEPARHRTAPRSVEAALRKKRTWAEIILFLLLVAFVLAPSESRALAGDVWAFARSYAAWIGSAVAVGSAAYLLLQYGPGAASAAGEQWDAFWTRREEARQQERSESAPEPETSRSPEGGKGEGKLLAAARRHVRGLGGARGLVMAAANIALATVAVWFSHYSSQTWAWDFTDLAEDYFRFAWAMGMLPLLNRTYLYEYDLWALLTARGRSNFGYFVLGFFLLLVGLFGDWG